MGSSSGTGTNSHRSREARLRPLITAAALLGLASAASAQIFGGQQQRLKVSGFPGNPGRFPLGQQQQQAPAFGFVEPGEGGIQGQAGLRQAKSSPSRRGPPGAGGGGGGGGGGGNGSPEQQARFRHGPFVAPQGAIVDDDDEADLEDTSLRRKKIVMFDVFNLYQPMATLVRALFHLFGRLWHKLETFGLSLFNRGDPPPDRMATIVVSWIVLAAFTILIGLCIKRCFFNLEHLAADDLEDDIVVLDGRWPDKDGNGRSGGPASAAGRRRSQRKAVKKDSFAQEPTNTSRRRPVTRSVTKKGLHRAFKPETSESKVYLQRWLDRGLSQLFQPGTDVWNRVRNRWIQALNEHTKFRAEKDGLLIQFNDISSSTRPRLRNIDVNTDSNLTVSLESELPPSLSFSLSAHHPHSPTASFYTLSPLLASSEPVVALVKAFCQPSSAVLTWRLPSGYGSPDSFELVSEGPVSAQRCGAAMLHVVKTVAVEALELVDVEVDVRRDLRMQRFQPDLDEHASAELCGASQAPAPPRLQVTVERVTRLRSDEDGEDYFVRLQMTSSSEAAECCMSQSLETQKKALRRGRSRLVWNQMFDFSVDPGYSSVTVQLWRWTAAAPLESVLVSERSFNVCDLKSPLMQRHILRLQEDSETGKDPMLSLKFQYVASENPSVDPSRSQQQQQQLSWHAPHPKLSSLECVQKTYVESQIDATTTATTTTYTSDTDLMQHDRTGSHDNRDGDDLQGEEQVGGHIGIALAALHDLAVKRRRRREASLENRQSSPTRTTMLIRSVQTIHCPFPKIRVTDNGDSKDGKDSAGLKLMAPPIGSRHAGSDGGAEEPTSSNSESVSEKSFDRGGGAGDGSSPCKKDEKKSKRRRKFISRLRKKFSRASAAATERESLQEGKAYRMNNNSKEAKSVGSSPCLHRIKLASVPVKATNGRSNSQSVISNIGTRQLNNEAKSSEQARVGLHNTKSTPGFTYRRTFSSNSEGAPADMEEEVSDEVIASSSTSSSSSCSLNESDAQIDGDAAAEDQQLFENEADLQGWNGALSLSWESVASGTYLMVPPQSSAGLDDASSLSEVSAISNSSSTLNVRNSGTAEDAHVILETSEFGGLLTRHYLLPSQLIKKAKIKRKGTKLHVVAQHIFVAKHIKSGTPCDICGRKLAKRLGKQGYMCRGCSLTCHKACHLKVETECPKSQLADMELLRGSTLVKPS